MDVIKQLISFKGLHKKTITQEHQTHLKDFKPLLAIVFIISFAYTIIDDFVYLGTRDENEVSYLGFMFGIIFQFIKLILMCFYLQRGTTLPSKRFIALERGFIIIFAASTIANWNIQLNIDPSRTFSVGLEAGWLFLYVHTLFHQWPWKAALYVSVSVFGVTKMALASPVSDFGCVQSSIQIILALMTAFIEEKRKRQSMIENISLEKSEQTFWNILNSLPDNIAILTLDGDLRFHNDYFDISFKVSESLDGVDVFSQIYQVKPRERHLNLKKIQDRHNNAKPLPRTKTLKVNEKIKRQGTLSKGGQDHPLIRYLTQELEFTNKKGTSVLGKGKKEKKARRNSRTSDHAPEKTLTEFFNSVNYFRDLQEVLDFFYGNVDLVRTYTERENNFFIFDGKYTTSEGLVKSYEIKILLSSLEEEENFVVILRDTTHRDIIVTLEDNNSFKDGVLSSISHELRTPLNTNLNLIELAINALNKFNKKNAIAMSPGGRNTDFPFSPETAINDIKEVYLVPAHKSGKLLESLINDILDYSMLVARKFVSHSKEKYLMKSLDKIRYLCEFQARKKNLEFHISLSQELNYKIKTDHKRLRQVLTNLMNNAIKFTSKGFVSLRIEPHPDNPSFIEFSVKDSGIGIAEANLERMTNVLEGGDFIHKVHKESSGIGLGLIISHRLAKELGPRASRISGIKVDSIIGEGSKFSFIIENWAKAPETLEARISGSPIMRPVKSANMPYVCATPTNASTRGLPITAYHTNPTLDVPLTTAPLETLMDKDALITKDLEIEDEIACMIKDDNLRMNMSENKLLKRHQNNKSSFSGNVVSGLLLNSSDPYSGVIGDLKPQNEPILYSNRSIVADDIQKPDTVQIRIPLEPRDKPEKGCICSEILVVDDDMFNLFTMENLLATLKFRITKATNGEEAIKVVLRRNELKCSSRCQTFKLIFMDLSMPVMDGFEATLKLRAMMKSQEIAEIPIVACTAFVDQDKTEKCYECGMEGRISKPVNKNKLKEILKRYDIIQDNES